MSGEAGTTLEGPYFSLFVGSGRMVSVATPPWEENAANYVGEYFSKQEASFRARLTPHLPTIERLVDEARQAGMPLVELSSRGRQPDFVLLPDDASQGQTNRALSYFKSTDRPALVQAEIFAPTLGADCGERLILTVALDAPTRRSALEELAANIGRAIWDVDPTDGPKPTD